MRSIVSKKNSKDNQTVKRNTVNDPAKSKITVSRVYSSASMAIQRTTTCPCDGGCPRCSDGSPIQAKQINGQTGHIGKNMQSQINSIKGGGQPLPNPVRVFFEPRFGHDFDKVRIHTDNRAANMASALGAKAFTKGENIVFGESQYKSESSEGRKLIAHELAHVVQQKGERRFKKSEIVNRGTIDPVAENQNLNLINERINAEIISRAPAGTDTLSMPVTAHWITHTEPYITVAGRDSSCDKKLWKESEVDTLMTGAAGIMLAGFDIKLNTKKRNMGCKPSARIADVAGGLEYWVKHNVKVSLPANMTHIFFIDSFQDSKGNVSPTIGEVYDIGSNLACISRSGNGRTVAHELGHTLDRTHEEPGYLDDDPDSNLMIWGKGTNVVEEQRERAREYGLKKGRLVKSTSTKKPKK